jgi:hypothetical protein
MSVRSPDRTRALTTLIEGNGKRFRCFARIQTMGGDVMTAIKPKLGSGLDGYWGSDGSVHVNYLGTDHHVHELYIAPGASWVDNNLTALA